MRFAVPGAQQLMLFQAEWTAELAGEVADLCQAPENTLPVILSRAEVHSALTAAPPLAGLALRTLYAACLRPDELFQLRRDQLQNGRLALPDRLLPLDPLTAASLAQLDGDRLFQELAPEQLLECLDPARYLAAGRQLTLAALRHAGATHLVENGMDLFALHRLLGNENLGCTRQYVHAAVALRGAAYSGCHPLMADQRALPQWNQLDFKTISDEFGDAEDDEPEPDVATPTPAEVRQLIAAAGSLRDRLILRLYYAGSLPVG